jgi:hypothetical protein
MDYTISYYCVNRFILYCTIGVFAFSAVTPVNALQKTEEVNLKDINFGMRMEKLIGKTKKYFN